MNTPKTLSFSRKDSAKFFRTLNKRVNDYFKDNNIKRTGNYKLWIKTVVMFTLFLTPYFLLFLNLRSNYFFAAQHTPLKSQCMKFLISLWDHIRTIITVWLPLFFVCVLQYQPAIHLWCSLTTHKMGSILQHIIKITSSS